MLRSTKEISGYTTVTLDNEMVGRVHDFYVDDQTWTVRYLVVDTGAWLPGRKVLISPIALGQPTWGGSLTLPISLSKDQIENSPPVDTDKPVSRQQEVDLAGYYQWPTYWDDVTFFDARAVGMDPETYVRTMRAASREKEMQAELLEKTVAAEQSGDPHLRSIDEVTGYYIHASDGDIGHVEEFIVDTEKWVIRYVVVDTKNWWPGKKVLVSPLWIDKIHWTESEVYIALTREKIKNSPEYDPSAPVNREYETRLYDYYGRPKYWG